MTPWLADPDVTLYHGDVLDVLRELPAKSVDCCVTSPPYWGLRDYGQEGQLGLEPTPEEYVTRMVEVFREVRRVLAAHGTVWLNLGDSYGSGTTADRNPTSTEGPDVPASWSNRSQPQRNGLKPKDLVGIPWRVAFALQADGWYLRSDIIWAKPNPMPESVTDRPTKAHEYVFLLSKQPRYFFDQEAVREAAIYPGEQLGVVRGTKRRATANGRGSEASGNESLSRYYAVDAVTPATGRNIRSVWEIATQPYPEAHFATFPEELARRCIAAGTSERICSECRSPWLRLTERVQEKPNAKRQRNVGGREDGFTYPAEPGGLGTVQITTIGWKPSCKHTDKYRFPLAATVLDPFMGSGTVAHVARKLGRHAVGIDLNESYLKLAARRLQQQSLFAEPAA